MALHRVVQHSSWCIWSKHETKSVEQVLGKDWRTRQAERD